MANEVEEARDSLAVARLERAMKGLTIGVVKDLQDWEKIRELDALQEQEEQIHVHVSGRAEEFAVWDRVELDFANVFVDATGQRDSPFDRPHFTFGSRIRTPDPVGVLACVMDWKTTDRNETIGAVVAIGVVGTDVAVEFDGTVHLTFQGYGSVPTGMPDDLGI